MFDEAALVRTYKLWGQAVEQAVMSGKILADDLIDLLKQQMVGEARRNSIIAVHQLIEHAPPRIESAEAGFYQPSL